MSIKEAIQTRKDVSMMKAKAQFNHSYGMVIWPKIEESKRDPDVQMMVEYLMEEKEKSDKNIFYGIVGEVCQPIIAHSGLKGKALAIEVIGALYDRFQ